MLKIGEIIMYRRTVCEVKDLLEKFRDGKDYYHLVPVYDDSLLINVPVDKCAEYCRPILTKAEVEALIAKIPEIDCLDVDDRQIENAYKDLFNSGTHEDLIKIIKTAYLRGEAKLEKGLKRSEKDKIYFRKAEESLYEEFAVVLGMSVDETRDFVVERVQSLKEN